MAKSYMSIEYSELTDRVVIGKFKRINNSVVECVGEKEDITNKFLDILFTYCGENEYRAISKRNKNDENTNFIINLKNDRESLTKGLKLLERKLVELDDKEWYKW